MKSLGKFFVPGDPLGCERHRTGQGRTYTPKRTERREELVKLMARNVTFQPIGKPVGVRMLAVYRRPKRPKNSYPHKPDLDNVAKLIMDGLNGTAWHDDSQVSEIKAQKRFARDGESVGVLVEVYRP